MSLREAIGIGALASVLLLGGSAAWAGDPVNASDLKWAPYPGLPKGAQLAVVSGDPAGKDLYVVRIRMPAGYRIPAHSHTTTEYVTVLSGTLHFGMGDKLDTNRGRALGPGGFVEVPAGMHHYDWTTGPTVMQIQGMGPLDITYVNPADDPRKAGA